MSTQNNSDSTINTILLVLAAIVIAPILMMVLAFPMFGMWGGMMGGFGGSGVSPMWGVGMFLVWLIVLVGIGYVIYRGVVSRGTASSDPALEELRLTYARGEISEEEFETRQTKLTRQSSRD